MKWSDLSTRERDALVAEKVMGGKRQQTMSVLKVDVSAKSLTLGGTLEYPRYSEDIAAAWEVVEAVRKRGFHFCLSQYEGNDYWTAQFDKHDLDIVGRRRELEATTPSEAICLAALKACGVRID